MTDRETELREQLAALHRRYQDEAAPIIDELTKIEAMRPRVPMVYRDLQDALVRRALVTPLPGVGQRPLDLMLEVQQRQNIDAARAMIDEMAARVSIQRYAIDGTVERIAPEDFYAEQLPVVANFPALHDSIRASLRNPAAHKPTIVIAPLYDDAVAAGAIDADDSKWIRGQEGDGPFQPIGTAPMDGTPLLLRARSVNATAEATVIGWYLQDRGWVELAFHPNQPVGIVPSAWMQLP